MTVAIHGTDVDVKKIVSRQVCRVSFEIPIEHYKQAVANFDGENVLLTKSNGDLPFGVIKSEQTKAKRKKKESEKAFLLTHEFNFYDFVAQRYGAKLANSILADKWLKNHLGIESKKELDNNDDAILLASWDKLNNDFRKYVNG